MLHQVSREAQTNRKKYGLGMPEYRLLLAILPRCKVRRMSVRIIGETMAWNCVVGNGGVLGEREKRRSRSVS